MNYEDIFELVKDDSQLQKNYMPVIIKTLLENNNEISEDSIVAELNLYNHGSDQTKQNHGLKLLADKKIIEISNGQVTLDLEVDGKECMELICACNKLIYFSQKLQVANTKPNTRMFLAQGHGKDWEHSFKNLPLRWGAKPDSPPFFEYRKMNPGDLILCRAMAGELSISNEYCFCFGVVKELNESDEPFWEEEVTAKQAIYPHRVIIDPVLFSLETSIIELPSSQTPGGVNYQKGLIEIKNDETRKELITQLQHYFPPMTFSLKSKQPETIEELIEKFDNDRNYLKTQKIDNEVFETKLKSFADKYLDFNKIKTLDEEDYAAGGQKADNFCDELKELLKDVQPLRIDAYGIYYKDNKISCHKSKFKDNPIEQIRKDLEHLLQIRAKEDDTIIDALHLRESLIPSDKASIQILFLLEPKKFLSIIDKDVLVNSLARFGQTTSEKHPINLQSKLIEIKNTHPTMKEWSNYDYSFFLSCIEEELADSPRHILAKFTKGMNGEIGATYQFSETIENYQEIQNETKIIFYDIDDDATIKFWGSGETNNIKFGSSGGSGSIENFEAYGIGDAKAISSLSEPLGELTPEKIQELEKIYDLTNKEIILISKETFEGIRKEIDEEKPFIDLPLPLPSDTAIAAAITEINNFLLIDAETIKRIIAALYSGKSILLTGPIGCGKTELAQIIPKIAWADYNGYYGEVVTATNDWTTQHVIGGIVPKLVKKTGEEEQVQFIVEKGVAARTVSDNWEDGYGNNGKRHEVEKEGRKYRGIWLIIDEFNRADIDKAFGGLLTGLEYRNDVGIKIPSNIPDVLHEKIIVPKDYRVIGTLNTKDKNKLFGISDALNRRFQTIEIFPPSFEKNVEEMRMVATKISKELEKGIRDELNISDWSELTKDDSDEWKYLIYAYSILSFVREYNNLGTALLIAVYKFILVFRAMKDENDENYSFDDCLDFALLNVILPQIEKLPPNKLKSIKDFAGGRIGDIFYNNEYDDDFNSQQELIEVKTLIHFINKHKETELSSDDWVKFFKGKSKSDRDAELQNDSVLKQKYDPKLINPWDTIIEYFSKNGGIDQNSKRPKLKRFVDSLGKIIKARTFDDDE